ncbi:MAG TPA: hypothetical protein EYG77_03115 [Methanothermococcus okinawensis]|nr:hypothetical protein [Methanothermococcus okinawensis]
MIKIYRFTGLSALLIILLILLLLFFLILLISPFIILLTFLIILYLVYRKFKKSISKLLKNLRKKKIKISGKSTKGEVEIHFAKNMPLESGNDLKNMSTLEIDPELDDFVKYLISKGFKYDSESGTLYYENKSVYPLYKETYPVNNIIRLYNSKPDRDIIVLGLKGMPNNPKFIYIIPVEEAKERMSIEELKRYLKKF